jgi:hypothetical protein
MLQDGWDHLAWGELLIIQILDGNERQKGSGQFSE